MKKKVTKLAVGTKIQFKTPIMGLTTSEVKELRKGEVKITLPNVGIGLWEREFDGKQPAGKWGEHVIAERKNPTREVWMPLKKVLKDINKL